MGSVFGIAIFLGAAVGGAVAWLAVRNDVIGAGFLVLFIVCGFLIGGAMLLIIAVVVDSGVVTTFVALAMDPQALQLTKPALYNKFRETYPRLNWVGV